MLPSVVLNRPQLQAAHCHHISTRGDFMRKKVTKVAALFPERRRATQAATSHATMTLPAIGTILASREDNGAMLLVVDFPGAPQGPVAARLGVALTAERIQTAIAQRQPAVLIFEKGDPLLPVVVGLVESRPTVPAVPPSVIEADVDGKRVRVVAQDEIVLQCGQASVTLRRNGRVVIRGTYVETQSEGTNRIKGGQVQIN